MKHKFYKYIFSFLATGFLGTGFAQKFDKKFTETFKTNKNVEVAINASNTDINVTTWNKNLVKVDAFIEIEGLTKKEAEKYFKDWEFEALGNFKKVKITSKGNTNFNFKNDFVFFDNMNFDFEMPEMDFSDFETIVIPDMNFDFDFDFDFGNLFEEIEENMGKDGKYEFRWKENGKRIEINTKEEWEAFKKTKKYADLKKKMQVSKEKMRKEFVKSKEKMRRELKKSKIEKQINKEQLRRQIKEGLEKAKVELKKLNFDFFPLTNSKETIINGKKVKIIKRLEIKVPKGATFNLNTRHCKVKLPNTVAFGNVKYGTFNANNLNGGKLTIDYSPVTINDLNACTLFLNNVTDAKIASVTNTTMNTNSSGVKIFRINENVKLTDKFGELVIESFNPNFGEFVFNLSQSDATIILGEVSSKFKYQVNKVKLNNLRVGKTNLNSNPKNLITFKGAYSNIVIK